MEWVYSQRKRHVREEISEEKRISGEVYDINSKQFIKHRNQKSVLRPGARTGHYGVYGGGKADTGVAVPADVHIGLKSAASSNLSSRRLRAPD